MSSGKGFAVLGASSSASRNFSGTCVQPAPIGMPGPSLSAAAAPFVRAVADAPAADAIVVLGARIHADGRPYSLLVDRLVTAEDLWRHGKAPRIVLSGRGGGGVGDDEVAAMRRFLAAPYGHDYGTATMLRNRAREVAARVWAWCEVAVAGRWRGGAWACGPMLHIRPAPRRASPPHCGSDCPHGTAKPSARSSRHSRSSGRPTIAVWSSPAMASNRPMPSPSIL